MIREKANKGRWRMYKLCKYCYNLMGARGFYIDYIQCWVFILEMRNRFSSGSGSRANGMFRIVSFGKSILTLYWSYPTCLITCWWDRMLRGAFSSDHEWIMSYGFASQLLHPFLLGDIADQSILRKISNLEPSRVVAYDHGLCYNPQHTAILLIR